MKIMTRNEQVAAWLVGIRVEIGAHYGSARDCLKYNARLGYPTVVLSAITGTTVMATLSQAADVWKYASGGLSLLVTILTSLQAFSQYPAKAAAHKAAAVDLTKLRHEIEAALTDEQPVTRDQMDSFRNRWDELSKAAPDIPDKVFQKFRKRLDEAEAAGDKPTHTDR